MPPCPHFAFKSYNGPARLIKINLADIEVHFTYNIDLLLSDETFN